MRIKYKIELVYDGSKFFGWQKQTLTTETIQTQIEKCLSELFKSSISTIGAGRTDAKVHSLDQHVVFDAPFEIPPISLVKGLNTLIDPAIRCKKAEIITEDFQPTVAAKSRTYKYLFTCGGIYSPFQRNFMSSFKYQIDETALRQASQLFCGMHDFKSFMNQGSDPKTTVREILSVNVEKHGECLHGIFPEHYAITIRGNGFLKQMVRLMVGALIDVGRGKIPAERITAALHSADGVQIAPCAPPEGLFKMNVEY